MGANIQMIIPMARTRKFGGSAIMVMNIKPRCIAELMEVDAESASMSIEVS
jgi:hypothetical protein